MCVISCFFTGARLQNGRVLPRHIQATAAPLWLAPHLRKLCQLLGAPQGCASSSPAPKPASSCLAPRLLLHGLVLPADPAANLGAAEPHLPAERAAFPPGAERATGSSTSCGSAPLHPRQRITASVAPKGPTDHELQLHLSHVPPAGSAKEPVTQARSQSR